MSHMVSIRPNSEDAIIEAAFEVLNADPSASLSDVAKRAGVGRATLHRYFSSRNELVRALALIAIEEMDTAVSEVTNDAKSYSDAFEKMIGVLIPLGDRHGFLAHDFVENDAEITGAFKRQTDEMYDLIEALKQEGFFSADLPTDWINQTIDYLLYASWDSVKQGDLTQKQAVELVLRTLTIGLGGPKV